MKTIYTYGAELVERHLTVFDLIQTKGKKKYTQVTADTFQEAEAAAQAGIDTITCDLGDYAEVRRGAPHTFILTALDPVKFISKTEILRAAYSAMEAGSDAIFTTRGLPVIEILSNESIPTMGHLGLLPRQSTIFGSLRAVGKTAGEAIELFKDFQRMQDAGAFAVEVELIPDEVMIEINNRFKMVTFSIGAGSNADVILQYMCDITGETETVPRHSKQYANLRELYATIQQTRIDALSAFQHEVETGVFPAPCHSVNMPKDELVLFKDMLTSK